MATKYSGSLSSTRQRALGRREQQALKVQADQPRLEWEAARSLRERRLVLRLSPVLLVWYAVDVVHRHRAQRKGQVRWFAKGAKSGSKVSILCNGPKHGHEA
jgi:hypothetical protein